MEATEPPVPGDASGTPGDAAASASDRPRDDGANQFAAVLRSPFRHLLYAALTTSLGDWIGLVAILALTEAIVGPSRATAFALSGVMIARVLPTMLLGPVAGVFADRWDRRRLLIATDIGRGVIMALIPFAQDIWALFLATLAVEIMATLFIPVKDAIVPRLVPKGHLVQANQLSLLSTYGTLPLGGFIFAAIVGLSGFFDGWELIRERPAALAIWLNSLTFFASAWFVSRIPGISGRPQRLQGNKETRPGAWEELVDGFRFITRHPLVRGLVFGVMGASLAAGTVMAVGIQFATVVNAGAGGFGILQGLVGTGLFLGIVATNWLEPRLGKERLFAPAIGVAGLALIATAFMPRLDLAGVTAVIMGAGGGVAFLTGYTMLQEHSTDEIRGRTFGAFNTGVRSALFLSLVIAPFAVGVIGPELVLDGVTAYQVGGVRITLAGAGAVALAGAIYSGRSVHTALLAGVEPAVLGQRKRGFFIVFEGGDGSGKSTQMGLLEELLRKHDFDPLITREPGGTVVGERIREVLLNPDLEQMHDRTEAMLYAAARAQHVGEVIEPALSAGGIVICDRYIDSSIVYQGVGRGLGSNDVARLNRWGTGGIEADLIVLLDVPADEGLRRAGKSPDRMERAGLDFHRRVNKTFHRLASMTPERYLIVDATAPVETVHGHIRDVVLRRLSLDHAAGDGDDEPDDHGTERDNERDKNEPDEDGGGGDDGDDGDEPGDGVGDEPEASPTDIAKGDSADDPDDPDGLDLPVAGDLALPAGPYGPQKASGDSDREPAVESGESTPATARVSNGDGPADGDRQPSSTTRSRPW